MKLGGLPWASSSLPILGVVWFQSKFYRFWAENNILSEKNSFKMSWFNVGFICTLILVIFGVKPKYLFVRMKEETEFKLNVDPKYALEEESG